MRGVDSRRRTLLRVGAAGFALGLAGCGGSNGGDAPTGGGRPDAGDDADGGGGATPAGVPDYADLLVPREDQIVAMYVDFDGYWGLFPESGTTDGGASIRQVADELPPMLKFSFGGGFSLLALAGLVLGPLGLSDLVDPTEGGEFETSVEEVVASPIRVRGNVVVDEIEEAVTSTPEDDALSVGMERVGESGDYVLYERAEDGTDDGDGNGSWGYGTVAASPGEIVVVESGGAVGRATGGGAGWLSAAPEYDPFEWVLSTAGEGVAAFGGYGPDGVALREEIGGDESFYEPGVLLESNGFVGSVSPGSEGLATDLAAVYDDLSGSQRDAVRSGFGASAADHTFEFGNDRFSVSGSFDRGSLFE
jgi:hypothetical protein